MVDFPIKVNFKDVKHSVAIEKKIMSKAKKLENYSNKVTAIRVMVTKEAGAHHSHDNYEIKVEVDIPGKKVVVDSGKNQGYTNAYFAINETFKIISRRLKRYVLKHKSKKNDKSHVINNKEALVNGL